MNKKIIVLLALFLLLTACAKETEPVPELLEPVGVSLDTAVVTRGTIARRYYYTGTVTPDVQEAKSPAEGRILEVLVQCGDTVQQGDILARLDMESVEKQSQALARRIEHEKEMGDLNLAQLTYALEASRSRLNSLYAAGVDWAGRRMQALDVEEKELALKQAEETLALTIEQLEEEQASLEETLEEQTLFAPCDGRIAYVSDRAAAGSRVEAYETLFAVAETENLYVITDHVTDGILRNAETVMAQIGEEAYALVEEPYPQEQLLAMILDPDTTVTSRFRIEGTADVREGDFASVIVEFLRKDDVLKIPVNALQSDENGSYVYKVVDGSRSRQAVSTGLITETEAEITDGLEEGDAVYVQK